MDDAEQVPTAVPGPCGANGDRTVRGRGSLSRFQAIKQVAPKLNASIESLRRWAEQAEIDTGAKPGVTSDAAEEIRRLKRGNAELRRANEILKTASASFAAELDRPTTN